MITIPAGVRITWGMGPTDVRKGIDGLYMLVQEVLKLDRESLPFCLGFTLDAA
jgi:transposase